MFFSWHLQLDIIYDKEEKKKKVSLSPREFVALSRDASEADAYERIAKLSQPLRLVLESVAWPLNRSR